MVDKQSMNRHHLPVLIGTLVIVLCVVTTDHAPWWATLPVLLVAAVVVGWHLDRRYLPVYIAVVVFTWAFTFAFNERADAGEGPTPNQPASTRITEGKAHRVSMYVVRKYLTAPLPGPRSFTVYRCHGGPRVWRCPAETHGSQTDCTTTVQVWSDGEWYYVEFLELRCS